MPNERPINRAVRIQYDLVNEIRPNEAHVFYARGEMFRLLEQGLLELPENTTVLFTHKHLDRQRRQAVMSQVTWQGRQVRTRGGYYVWANAFNRWSDMRTIRRSPEEIERTSEFIESGNTDIMLLNVGCLREKGFHIRQYMNLANNYPHWKDRAGGSQWYACYVKEVLGTESSDLEEVYATLATLKTP